MSAKDQIKQLVDYFKREPYLKDKTDAMGDGLMLGASLADEANERSKEATTTTKAIQDKYKEQILAQDLNPNKDPELVDLRNGNATAGERITKFEQETTAQFQQTSAQLAQIAINVNNYKHLVVDNDWTLAIQTALDTKKPIKIPQKETEYDITDSLRLYDGSIIIGDYSQGNYIYNSTTRINFKTSTKKDLFVLDESAIKQAGYIFNISISGLSIQGTNGGSIFNLPDMSNLHVSDVKSFGHFDYAVTINHYLDSLFTRCSFQNISKAHVRSIVTGEISTTTTFEKCYFSHGNIGVLVETSSTNSLVFNDCIFESLKTVLEQHANNRVFMYGCYVEKVPMNDTEDDAAFILGVPNSSVTDPYGSFLYSGGIIQGYIGSTVNDYPVNASLIKTYDIRNVSFIGTDISRFKYLMENNNEITFTRFVGVTGGNIDNYGKKVNWDKVSVLGSSFDYIVFEGEVGSSVSPAIIDNIHFAGSNSQSIGNSKLFKDEHTERVSFKDSEGKVYRLGNKSVQDTINFTGLGKLQKGEIVFNNIKHELGTPVGYVASEFSKDEASLIFTGTTTVGSNVIKSSTSENPFWSFKVGDYVFFDKGFKENEAYRIIAKSSGNSTISVESSALSSQTNVTVRTLDHNNSLIPFGQIGYRRKYGTPVGDLTPYFIGEEIYDFSNNNWFKSTGSTSQDWKQMTQ